MGILDNLFDARTRRQRRLEALTEQRAELQAEFEATIAAGEDTDKVQAKLAKVDAEVASVRTAIDATERAEQKQRQASADAERDRLEAIAVTAFHDYGREAEELAELVSATLRERLQLCIAAYRVARAARARASGAGARLTSLDARKLEAKQLCNRLFAELLRDMVAAGEITNTEASVLLPSGTATFSAPGAMDVLRAELAARPQPSKESLE